MSSRIDYRQPALALLVGLAAALLLAWLPRLPRQMLVHIADIGTLIAEGETSEIRSFYGFNQAETAGETRFRWTDGAGNLVVRSGARLGSALVLRMRLCGCRAGPDAVSQLLLRVNGVTFADAAEVAGRPEWRRYAVLVQPEATAYSPDLLVELVGDTIKNPQFGFPMGVALDTLEVAPAWPQRAYDPQSALLLGLAVGGLALVYRTKDEGRPTTDDRRPTEGSFFHPSSIVHYLSSILPTALAVGLVAAQGLLYRPQPLPAELLAIGLLLALAPAMLIRAALAVRVALAVLLGALVLAPQVLGAWMLDDAYISFRYAANALAGAGLVFNPGERVEGYTNFLWTVLFVPILAARIDPALAAQAITLLLALAIAALAWFGARRLAGTVAATLALALLVGSTPFVLYAARGSGMETALFTLLVLGGVLAYLAVEPRIEDRGWRIATWPSSLAGALLALAAMTRPEGVLVVAVCGLHLLVSGLQWPSGLWLEAKTRRREDAKIAASSPLQLFAPAQMVLHKTGQPLAWRDMLGLALGFLALFGPYYLWRFSYYGYPLPNTFYAKVGGTSAQALRGLSYAAEFAASQAPLIAIALLGALLGYLTANRRRSTNDAADHATGRPGERKTRANDQVLSRSSSSPVVGRQSSLLWLLVGVYTLYIVAVGGDHFPYYRFFVPLLPLLALLAALGFAQLQQALPTHLAVPALALLAAGALGWQAPQLYASRTFDGAGRVWSENSVVEKNREIGLWLRAHTLPDTLLATGIAGAMPFYAERPTLDTLGLNDLHIAHLDVPTIGQGVAGAEKTDNDYILVRRPAYIPYSSAGALLEHPEFLKLYDRGIVHGPEGRWLRLYKRHDLPPPEGWAAIDDR
jgi:hypothetical protein